MTLGSQTLTITDAGIDGNNIFTGAISGTGSLSITGGEQIIDGTNTYTGGTIITSGGALQIGNDDTAGSITGNITNAGNLAFDRTNSITIASTISGAGEVTEENGTSPSPPPSPIPASPTSPRHPCPVRQRQHRQFFQRDRRGHLRHLRHQRLRHHHQGAERYGQCRPGWRDPDHHCRLRHLHWCHLRWRHRRRTGGSLVVTGGTTILGGTNTYTGATTVTSGGTLQLGSGATTGTMMGSISNTGTVVFDYASLQPFSAVITGGGAVQVISGGISLSSVQTYTGLTTITAGTLQLLPGGDISASSGLVANGTFDISATSGATIASLSGTGVVQLGRQTLTINNTSGKSSNFSGAIEGTTGGITLNNGTEILSGTGNYTGTTTINAGATLSLTSLNALIGSPIVVNSAGATVGTLDISAAINNLSNIVSVNVSSVAGSGNVTLGNNTLIILNANNTTFSGDISGTGNLTINGGTETLTGDQQLYRHHHHRQRRRPGGFGQWQPVGCRGRR